MVTGKFPVGKLPVGKLPLWKTPSGKIPSEKNPSVENSRSLFIKYGHAFKQVFQVEYFIYF